MERLRTRDQNLLMNLVWFLLSINPEWPRMAALWLASKANSPEVGTYGFSLGFCAGGLPKMVSGPPESPPLWAPAQLPMALQGWEQWLEHKQRELGCILLTWGSVFLRCLYKLKSSVLHLSPSFLDKSCFTSHYMSPTLHFSYFISTFRLGRAEAHSGKFQ